MKFLDYLFNSVDCTGCHHRIFKWECRGLENGKRVDWFCFKCFPKYKEMFNLKEKKK